MQTASTKSALQKSYNLSSRGVTSFWVGREGAIRGFIYQKKDMITYCTMALAYEKESIYNGVAQIFDSLVHFLKVVQIKNSFGILQANPQTPKTCFPGTP